MGFPPRGSGWRIGEEVIPDMREQWGAGGPQTSGGSPLPSDLHSSIQTPRARTGTARLLIADTYFHQKSVTGRSTAISTKNVSKHSHARNPLAQIPIAPARN